MSIIITQTSASCNNERPQVTNNLRYSIGNHGIKPYSPAAIGDNLDLRYKVFFFNDYLNIQYLALKNNKIEIICLYSTIPYTVPGIITHPRGFIIARGEAECSKGHSRVSNIPRYSIGNCGIKQL